MIEVVNYAINTHYTDNKGAKFKKKHYANEGVHAHQFN